MKINMGGNEFRMEIENLDESLEKMNELLEKIKEAKSLIGEIASMELEMKFKNFGGPAETVEQPEDSKDDILS